ncbi:TPA: cation:proton antiporter [Candidatus Bathyarchaeota archaeon]|nr:cation:proton antiporter [Candidatus Bathyarchaeota archaeon]
MQSVVVSLMVALAGMFFASYILHFPLDRYRMPTLLAPLLVGFLFQLLPNSVVWTGLPGTEGFTVLSTLGIMFLLLTVGVQLEPKAILSLGRPILLISVLNMGFSTLLGYVVLTWFGYPPLVSLVVSTALATVAETTIAPILDELGVIKSREASLILCPGIVDDIAEVILASVASVMVGATSAAVDPLYMILGFALFIGVALLLNRVILPRFARFEGTPNDNHLLILLLSSILTLVAITQSFGLGILLGSIVAGLSFQRFLRDLDADKRVLTILRALSYGFLGPVFFFGIGLDTGLGSMAASLPLTLLLLVANFIGKFLSAYAVGRLMGMSMKSILVVGLGLSAKFSMGIIPVQIFFSAGVIDEFVFSSFIAVSTITTVIIPFSLAYIINRWRGEIFTPQEGCIVT